MGGEGSTVLESTRDREKELVTEEAKEEILQDVGWKER